MVELVASADPGQYRQGLGGDSYNTAIYMARQGLAVDYLTRLGDDGFSSAIVAQLQAEGIGTALIPRVPGRQPGLYLVSNDDHGEREFRYWREHSPARELFDQPLSLSACQAFYFTGITLAVTRSGTGNLKTLLEQLRQQGTQILFDPNYRPRLWQNEIQAQGYYREILPLCDTVLPTLEDETALWGIESPEDCAAMYRDFGATEVVIKTPDLAAHAYQGEQRILRRASAVTAVDTTGAGDSFNAAYLAARLQGEPIESALAAGQALAAVVVQHRGAVLEPTARP
jgi:2-dehydro-3-deoxygluconokinase